MSDKPGFTSRYGVPNNNIVIIPTVSFKKNSVMPLAPVNPSIPKGIEQNVPSSKIVTIANTNAPPLIEHQQKKQPLIEISTLAKDQLESKVVGQPKSHLERNITELLINEEINKNVANVENLNKPKKVTSWASNYLQSIGHNNIKPIKINLSARNKIQRIETISAMNNESKMSLPNQPTSSSHEVFNMTENPLEIRESNENVIAEHINVGNIKTLHPVDVNTNDALDVHINVVPVPLRCDNNIPSAPVNCNVIHELAKGNGKAYCYSDANHKIDLLDAIKLKINHECAMEQKSRVMNLATHKDMCENFIKEISNNKPKPTTSGKKANRTKPSPPTKNKELECKIKKKYATSKTEEKIKKIVKNEKNNILNKEALKNLKKNTSDKERLMKSKYVSVEKDKPKKEENKINQDLHLKKQQNKKPIIDLNDFDSFIFNNKTEKQLKTQSKSPERQKLKRVRADSVDLPHSSSEIHIHSPIKSVVLVAENHHNNSPKKQLLNDNFDLRSKLSRVNKRTYKKQTENDINTNTKLRDNLKITFENQHDEKRKSPKRPSVLQYKTKKCKKLKLIINVVCQESDDETTSSDSSYNETENPTHNIDLSFLDDINVDEIVACLKHSPKHKMKSPLPHDSKREDNIKMPAESERQLATLLNMLQAKSETNKIKSPTKIDCKIEESIKRDSSTRSNIDNPNLFTDIQKHMDKDENANKLHNSIKNTNTTHSLVKILSQTNLQLQQQNTAPFDDGYLKAKCDALTKEFDVEVINKEHELPSEGDSLVIDESVILNEQEVIIIDLTDETECMTTNTNNDTISATPNYFLCEKQCNEDSQGDLNIGELKNNVCDSENDQKGMNDNQLEPIISVSQNKNSKSVITSDKMDVEVVMDIMHNDNKSIDLTNDTEYDVIKSNLSTTETVIANAKITNTTEDTNKNSIRADRQLNVNTQIEVVSEIQINQDIHSPTEKPEETAKNNDSEKRIHENISIETESKLKETVDSTINNSDKEMVIKNKTNKESSNIISVKIAVNNDTKDICTESNTITEEEKQKKTVENVIVTTKESGMTTKDTNPKNNKDMRKVFETKAAIKIVNNIVENVCNTKNEHENVSQTDVTKDEIGHTSKMNNDSKTKSENTTKINVIEKKVQNPQNEPTLTGQHQALVLLMEERMLNYMNKEIKVIKHIRLGKFSNIFSCKDSSGQMYAAKVLKNQNNRLVLGIQKEQMIRQLQQDIPKENLNTIYLIDGFGVDRYWCFLTEYYPKNLNQVLKQRKKPFHIKLVQHLARQLISAVMVLRNNEIVHSDIKPTHILLNSNHNNLKLCGFDSAYYINNVNLLPNIGTADFRAPEIIIGFSAGYSIDVWSSALVIYQMATNQQLFTGVYNNDILFKQMCTFGNLPRDMIEASLYQNKHFQGRTFMRRVGFKGQDAILFQKFYKTKRLHMTLISAYYSNFQTKNVYKRNVDIAKMTALNKLLDQMLLLDPRHRLAIEFVCADPFIYDIFVNTV